MAFDHMMIDDLAEPTSTARPPRDDSWMSEIHDDDPVAPLPILASLRLAILMALTLLALPVLAIGSGMFNFLRGEQGRG